MKVNHLRKSHFLGQGGLGAGGGGAGGLGGHGKKGKKEPDCQSHSKSEGCVVLRGQGNYRACLGNSRRG